MRNFTHFFETGPLNSSESFWTSLFALHLLHLGEIGGTLKIWSRLDRERPPYYSQRKERPFLELGNVTWQAIAIEPRCAQMGAYLAARAKVPIREASFEPDVVLTRTGDGDPGPRYTLIENKITQVLQENQMENYPRLVKKLMETGSSAQALLLMSVGSRKVDKQARRLQHELDNAFGILLWEDVLRDMNRTQLDLPGVNFQPLENYTTDLEVDADWECTKSDQK